MNNNMWFIDKLNVQQVYDYEIPIVGNHGVIRYDLASGETISHSPNSLKYEDSGSGSVQIRSDGSKLTVTGNPSRFNRVENLFGFTTFDQCIFIYNKILGKLGLPELTKCSRFYLSQSKENESARLISDGAMFDHIDFTRNFAVGSGAEHKFIRALSAHKIGKGQEPYLYANGMTTDWYKGSTSLYKKVYCKAHDLESRKKKNLKEANPNQINEYEKALAWCESQGIVREEHGFKQKWLRRKKLCFYGITKESDFNQYLKDIENVMKRLQIADTQYERISEQLISQNIVQSPQAANATENVYTQWLHGQELKMSRSQLYKHRKRLIPLGIDISLPHDITKMALKIKSNDLIDIRYLEPPSWYQVPNHLSLVS